MADAEVNSSETIAIVGSLEKLNNAVNAINSLTTSISEGQDSSGQLKTTLELISEGLSACADTLSLCAIVDSDLYTNGFNSNEQLTVKSVSGEVSNSDGTTSQGTIYKVAPNDDLNVGDGASIIKVVKGVPTASTSTVGSTTKPVFLNKGALTASSASVGGSKQGVYLSNGEFKAVSDTVGGSGEPVYLKEGVPTAITKADLIKTLFGSDAIGSTTKPVYFNGTTFVAANDYPTGIDTTADYDWTGNHTFSGKVDVSAGHLIVRTTAPSEPLDGEFWIE